MAVKAKPDGYHAVTPYLVVDGAARLIDFLEEVFDAEEVERFAAPGNRIGHAEVRIGDSLVMLGDAHGEHKPMQAMLYVYVDDADATYQRALAAGATSVQAPVDQFYGDRSGGVKDPCGNLWWIATHIEDVPPDELKRRAQAAMEKAGGELTAGALSGLNDGFAPLNPSYGLCVASRRMIRAPGKPVSRGARRSVLSAGDPAASPSRRPASQFGRWPRSRQSACRPSRSGSRPPTPHRASARACSTWQGFHR